MSIKNNKSILQLSVSGVVWLLSLTILFNIFTATALASAGKTEVPGKVYEFDRDSHYEFSDSDVFANADTENTYGTFFASGDISNVDSRDGVPAYEVAEGNLSLFYNYGDALLNAGEDSWHLTEDKDKKVDTLTLDHNILRGALILQTSRDRLTWIDEAVVTDAFAQTPVQTEAMYSTTDVQLINGCFYRLIVAYELCVRTEDSNFLLINTDKYDYKKCAEVYEFYAYTDKGDIEAVVPGDGYRLGNKVRVEEHDGYFGEKEIKKGDLHYGDHGAWDLGKFFVSGYTDEVLESNGKVVFLKNVGDEVILWFNLEQNINALNGNEKLSITADPNGYDQYFGTASMNFGRGALIVRKTDYNNIPGEPAIYTNYLEANATVGADTIVQLCEEGDYEVALDYEITSDGLIDKIGHYRIFFEFSVRNGNCMVYPFDVITGSELRNSSMTENGFRLDLAKSRYLNINIKREILTDRADGLAEDTRFNGPAKDGDEYTDEGIYTITVQNRYTGQFTTKKIYVGTNNVLRAYMTTGLSIPEINTLLEQGATISDDGNIEWISAAQPVDEQEEKDASDAEDTSSDSVEDNSSDEQEEIRSEDSISLPVMGGVAGIVCVAVILVLMHKRRKARQEQTISENDGGGE